MAQHVLVPVDGSAQSDRALQYALDELSTPKVTLLHVVTPSGVFEYDDDHFDENGYLQEAKQNRDRGRELLDTYRDTAADRGVAVETTLAFGKPAKEILDTVDAAGVDHVVMGSRGRSGLDRVLFGSVAEAVTRRATVPVTIVP